METLDRANPALPMYAALPSLVVFCLLLALLLNKPGSRASYFILAAIWMRYVLSAFPQYSLAASPAGLSWNAIASVLVIGVGLLVVRKRSVLDIETIPITILSIVIVISAVMNHVVSAGIESVVKYIYLLMLILTFVDAAEDIGFANLLGRILWLYVIPLLLQAESFILRLPKATEADGSLSYIGGYHHEAGFSIVLITGMMVICFNDNLKPLLKTGLIGLFGFGIILANYRTSMIAVFPLLLVTFASMTLVRFKESQRLIIGAVVFASLAGATVAAAPLFADRFETLTVALSKGTDLIKPPESFTFDDRQIMSGRALIWSQYFYGWVNSTSKQHLFGLGPNSWEGVFAKYAHNTILSTLYEFGIVGVIAMLLMWLWMLVLAVRIRSPVMPLIVAAHVGFILLNQATMPFWLIEGLIFYGIACGSAVYWFRKTRPVAGVQRFGGAGATAGYPRRSAARSISA